MYCLFVYLLRRWYLGSICYLYNFWIPTTRKYFYHFCLKYVVYYNKHKWYQISFLSLDFFHVWIFSKFNSIYSRGVGNKLMSFWKVNKNQWRKIIFSLVNFERSKRKMQLNFKSTKYKLNFFVYSQKKTWQLSIFLIKSTGTNF